MANFAQDIMEIVGGETVEGIVIRYDDYLQEERGSIPKIPRDRQDKLIPYGEALVLLNYDFDDGYGGQDCHNVFVWTPTRVIFVHEYDGSTRLISVWRNPNDWRHYAF